MAYDLIVSDTVLMQLNIFKDYAALSHNTAEKVVHQVQEKANSVLCLAAGNTPTLTYQYIVEIARQKQVDFSQVQFVGLDEWVHIPPDNPGSCQYFLRHHLFTPLQIAESQIHLFDALAEDLASACEQMNALIRQQGGLDLILVGVGMNGHIGFNEPGVSPDLYAHVVDLDETTQVVGQKYFSQSTPLKKGITLGMRHVLEARSALMIASGAKKAEIMRKVLVEDISVQVPASLLRKHDNGFALLDEEAASLLTLKAKSQY